MLDTLLLHVPMMPEFVEQIGNLYTIKGDVADYQVLAVPSYLKRDEQGNISYGLLKHPFESVPSSFASMAIKFNAVNVANTFPYVSLSASPKILQGHNVYGGESVRNLASEMLALLQNYYPMFFACLDVRNTTISRIDSTYSVKLPSPRLIQPCIRFLSNISNGQRRNDKDKRDFFNTVYWGGATTRYGNAVAYGKHCDVMREIKDLQSRVNRGCTQSASKLEIFTPELVAWSECLLRFESRTKRRKLEQLGLPTNLWDFINHQSKNKGVLNLLWRMWFDPILNALEGDVMDDYDDSTVYDLCCDKLKTYTKAGKLSLTKANNAFNFYQLLKSNGWSDVKSRYSNNAFHTSVRSLVGIGIPRALLQNLNNQVGETIPMVELISFDFSNQYPADYVPPISAHIGDFDKYLKPNLRIVA